MPIYEYSCPKCGRFEALQKISDEPLTAKPDCNCADCPKAATREIFASAFHLKGSGWYKTDYSAGSSGGGAKNGKSEAATAAESSSGSADAKAETKSETKVAGCGTGCGCH